MDTLLELLNNDIEFEQPPADLCLKCGKCCKTIATDIPYSQLVKMAQNNEEEAKVFFNVFKKYSDVNQAIAVNPKHTQDVINHIKKNINYRESDIAFYYCPYLSKENLCTIYNKRPECCKRAPINGWALFPEGCGYEGWQFLQREKHKSRIRKLKEFLYELEVLVPNQKKIVFGMTVEELKNKIKEKINAYACFGSDKW